MLHDGSRGGSDNDPSDAIFEQLQFEQCTSEDLNAMLNAAESLALTQPEVCERMVMVSRATEEGEVIGARLQWNSPDEDDGPETLSFAVGSGSIDYFECTVDSTGVVRLTTDIVQMPAFARSILYVLQEQVADDEERAVLSHFDGLMSYAHLEAPPERSAHIPEINQTQTGIKGDEVVNPAQPEGADIDGLSVYFNAHQTLFGLTDERDETRLRHFDGGFSSELSGYVGYQVFLYRPAAAEGAEEGCALYVAVSDSLGTFHIERSTDGTVHVEFASSDIGEAGDELEAMISVGDTVGEDFFDTPQQQQIRELTKALTDATIAELPSLDDVLGEE